MGPGHPASFSFFFLRRTRDILEQDPRPSRRLCPFKFGAPLVALTKAHMCGLAMQGSRRHRQAESCQRSPRYFPCCQKNQIKVVKRALDRQKSPILSTEPWIVNGAQDKSCQRSLRDFGLLYRWPSFVKLSKEPQILLKRSLNAVKRQSTIRQKVYRSVGSIKCQGLLCSRAFCKWAFF